VQVQEAIAAETRQAIDQIKNEVADLTLLATEKVVGRALDRPAEAAAPDRRGARRGRLLQAAGRRVAGGRRSRRSGLRHGRSSSRQRPHGRATAIEPQLVAIRDAIAASNRAGPAPAQPGVSPPGARRRSCSSSRPAPIRSCATCCRCLVDNGRLTALIPMSSTSSRRVSRVRAAARGRADDCRPRRLRRGRSPARSSRGGQRQGRDAAAARRSPPCSADRAPHR